MRFTLAFITALLPSQIVRKASAQDFCPVYYDKCADVSSTEIDAYMFIRFEKRLSALDDAYETHLKARLPRAFDRVAGKFQLLLCCVLTTVRRACTVKDFDDLTECSHCPPRTCSRDGV